MSLKEPQHGVGAAQRLEAADAEALAFVLVNNLAEACCRRELCKPPQRRRPIARPRRDLAFGLGQSGQAKNLLTAVAAIRLRARDARVCEQPQAGGIGAWSNSPAQSQSVAAAVGAAAQEAALPVDPDRLRGAQGILRPHHIVPKACKAIDGIAGNGAFDSITSASMALRLQRNAAHRFGLNTPCRSRECWS